MKRDTLEYDPIRKSALLYHYNEDDDLFHLEHRADVEDVIEMNKALHAGTDERCRWGEMERVASIPEVIVEDLIRRGIWQDDGALRHWLNQPENRFMRVRPGEL